MIKKFLFVTANANETKALLKLKDDGFFKYEEKRSNIISDTNFYNVGRFGCDCYQTVHFELNNMGSTKSDASILSVYDAIKFWQPNAVFLVGIAFGKCDGTGTEQGQHIGDVLISEMVVDYESGKFEKGELQSDGFIADSGRHLLSVFKHYSKSWKHRIGEREAQVITGAILSGDKVVNDEAFKQQIFARNKRAIGGEMEGRGAYVACRRHELNEWLVVKAICDWGVHKECNKTQNQIIAAESTVSLLRHVFSDPKAFDKLPTGPKNKSENKQEYTMRDTPKTSHEIEQREKPFNGGDGGIKGKNVMIFHNSIITGGNVFGVAGPTVSEATQRRGTLAKEKDDQ